MHTEIFMGNVHNVYDLLSNGSARKRKIIRKRRKIHVCVCVCVYQKKKEKANVTQFIVVLAFS